MPVIDTACDTGGALANREPAACRWTHTVVTVAPCLLGAPAGDEVSRPVMSAVRRPACAVL